MISENTESEALVKLREIKMRIEKDGEDAKITPEDIEILLDDWNSWVLDNELIQLGLKKEDRIEISNIINMAKTIEIIKRGDSTRSLLAVIKFLCIKNDFYKSYLAKVYFVNE